MREIKFRAWHIKRKKYYEVHHLHIGTIGIHEEDWATCKAFNCIEQKDIYIQIQPKECFIEQFTGLHDKNGREIYEGDKFCISGIIMFVSWNEDRARFILTTGRGYDTINCINLDCDVVYEKEIIGNIHEATK